MSKEHQGDTDLINELVETFGKNQETLKILVAKVNDKSSNDIDILAQGKLKNLRREILIEDVKSQDHKIEMITNVLDEIESCSPKKLPTE